MYAKINRTSGGYLAKNGKDIAVKAGTVVVAAILGAILMAKYKDRAYKELLKKHDKETAKRLSDEFKRDLDKIEERHKDNDDKLKQRIKELCIRYKISPEVIMK